MQCQLIDGFFQAMERIQKERGVAREYGAGVLLYHSELSLLEAVHQHPEQQAAALAQRLGITNSALTQTAKKLMDKGLIEQYTPPGNRRQKYHRLTALGMAAREGHMRYHQDANARMKDYLCARTQEEKRVLTDFFQVLGECGQVCLFECGAAGCGCGQRQGTNGQGGNTDAGA